MAVEKQIWNKQSDNLHPLHSAQLLTGVEEFRNQGKGIENDQVLGDTAMKKEFLYLIGLLDRETAEYVIQKSRRIKLRHKLQTEYLIKKMLKMQPRFYFENGKVKRLQRTPQKTKKPYQRNDRKKQINRKCNESRGVYFTIPKNQNSSGSARGSRYHLSRKVVTAQGLSKKSKKLIQLCKDLSVRVLRMSDQEIAKLKTKNPRKEVRAEMRRPSSSVQIQNEQVTARPSKRRHRYLNATVDLYNMTEQDIQTAQNLQKKSKFNKPI